MYYNVLHILDSYLPETMNWLEELLNVSSSYCRHFIYADYYIREINPAYEFVNNKKPVKYPVPIKEKLKNRLLYCSNTRQLTDFINNNKIQFLHFHFGNVAIKYMSWIKKTKLPFFISLYGFDYEFLVHKYPGTKRHFLELSRLTGFFIVEGRFSKKLMLSYGIPATQLGIVRMLFNRNVISEPLPLQSPVKLLQVATYTEKKNQFALIEAMQDRHIGKFNISFYGEVRDEKYYRELGRLTATKKEHSIQINGGIPLSDYLIKLCDSHFVINLSKRTKDFDTEGGCPVLLKDSLSVGKPVITSYHCDIPELVVNGYNGYIIKENDAKAIVDILDQLVLMSQKEYRLFCRNALESVSTNISQNITGVELKDVYQSVYEDCNF